MNDRILNLPLDPNKRHFVVGDIHGRFDAFLDLLAMVDYDPNTDIIYSVGDVIDRGPKIYETIEFFKRPNTYLVRGNHEDMVANRIQWEGVWLNNGGYETVDALIANGITTGSHTGFNGKEIPHVDIDWLTKFCIKLPYVIDVGEQGEENAFRIVHAEVPPLWNESFFQKVLKEGLNSEMMELMWSRSTVVKAVNNVKGMKPSHYGMVFSENRSGRNIFVGHTPIRHAMVVGDMTYIDTWASRTLTMVNAVTKERFVAKVA